MIAAILTFLFILLIVLGVPIAFSIGMVTVIGILYVDIPLITVAQRMFTGLDSFVLLAVPLFILAANMMNAGQISHMLLRFSLGMVGHIRGALAHATVVVSMIFAGISGSSSAEVAAIGSVAIPNLIKEGYPKNMVVGLTAAAATIGVIIPPSIIMVIYGSLANASVGALFLGGFIPGILVGLGQMTVVYFYAKKYDFPVYPRIKAKDLLRLFIRSLPPLLTPAIILGGIVGGIVTPTEAAMLACVYAFIISMFLYRTLHWSDLPAILWDTLKLSSLALFALSTACALGELLSYFNVSKLVTEFFITNAMGPNLFLLIVVLFLLFIGTFMDAIPAMIIFVPVLLPTAKSLGIHEIHFGLITTVALAIGLVTPPYGMCLMLASKLGNIQLSEAFKGVIPFLLVILGVLLLITYIPDVALLVPKMIKPDWFGLVRN